MGAISRIYFTQVELLVNCVTKTNIRMCVNLGDIFGHKERLIYLIPNNINIICR